MSLLIYYLRRPQSYIIGWLRQVGHALYGISALENRLNQQAHSFVEVLIFCFIHSSEKASVKVRSIILAPLGFNILKFYLRKNVY